MKPEQLQRQIEAFLAKPEYRPMKMHAILGHLGLDNSQRKLMRKILRQMESDGLVEKLGSNRIAWTQKSKSAEKNSPQRKSGKGEAFSEREVTGILSLHPHGFGFLAVEPEETDVTTEAPPLEEVFIPPHATGLARQGDRVRAKVVPSRKKGAADGDLFEGAILEILERGTLTCVGTLRKSGGNWSLLPDDSRFKDTVRVRDFEGVSPKSGHKVVVRLDDRASASERESGVLIEDLGHMDDVGVDILAIMRTHNLTSDFSDEVMKEALAYKVAVTDEDVKVRRDLRDKLIFTIDPEDARDFDDALNIDSLENGAFRVGIHIADVAHFVTPDGPLDMEARERGTSAYLVDRVVPMLPEHLTNDLCSLVPNQDRLAHSVFLDINPHGKVVSVDTCRSVIHSKARLTYEDAQTLLDGGMVKGLSDEVRDAVLSIGRLTRKLRKKRMREYALNFEMPETRCVLDKQGQVIGFTRKISIEANHLVEECMLMANREVGALLAGRFGIAIYRIHDEPSEEDFKQMAEELRQMGIDGVPVSRETLNEIIGREMADPMRQAVTITLLKNMNRAVYSEELGEHFGLAFDTYTHFTSPIRRYPDLIAHRLLVALEQNLPNPYTDADLRKICIHSSERERAAAAAEQETIETKRLHFYLDQLNQGHNGPYPAKVSNVIPRGVLVELTESGQRGLIPFPKLDGDYYEVNSTGTRATGRKTGRVIQLGDDVEVRIDRVDLESRQVDFLPERM